MPKVPAQEFFRIVREVVRDEIKKSMPQMVKECLTETYLRQMITEIGRGSNRGRKDPETHSRLAETLMGDPEDEITPETLEPAGDGIYQKSKLIKPEQTNEIISRLLSKDNKLSALYEGVRPIPADSSGSPEIPEQIIEKIIDKDMIRRLAFGSSSSPTPQQSSKTAEWEEQRLARLRESLDRPVSGGQRRSESRPMPQFARSSFDNESTSFPDAPIPGA